MSVSTNVTATVPTRYRNAILRLTRERVLRGKRDGNGMWRFSAFDLLNFLYDEDELSGAARVVWGILLSHTEQYAVRDILLECEYIDDECCERCDCECGEAWSNFMAPCMPISTLSEMLTALDLVGCGRAADDENREIVEEALKQCLDGDFSSCREVAECEDSSPSSLPCFHARELVSSSSGTLGEREQHTDDELSDASDESMSSMSPVPRGG